MAFTFPVLGLLRWCTAQFSFIFTSPDTFFRRDFRARTLSSGRVAGFALGILFGGRLRGPLLRYSIGGASGALREACVSSGLGDGDSGSLASQYIQHYYPPPCAGSP